LAVISECQQQRLELRFQDEHCESRCFDDEAGIRNPHAKGWG
jgi:hypothetical protein